MKTIAKLLLTALGLAVVSTAHASFICSGLISFLGMSRDGSVYLANGFGVWNICTVAATLDGAPADACKAWYASLLSAQKTGTRTRVYFNNADGPENGSLCSSVGNWVVPGALLYFIDFLPN